MLRIPVSIFCLSCMVYREWKIRTFSGSTKRMSAVYASCTSCTVFLIQTPHFPVRAISAKYSTGPFISFSVKNLTCTLRCILCSLSTGRWKLFSEEYMDIRGNDCSSCCVVEGKGRCPTPSPFLYASASRLFMSKGSVADNRMTLLPCSARNSSRLCKIVCI